MDAFLDKNYVLVNSEHFEEYLTFIGVGLFKRKVALTLKQSVRLSRKEDGSYKFEFISTLASSTIEFTPGVEFEEVRPDGAKVKSVITIEGNIMTHKQTDDKGRICTHIREFSEDKLSTTTTAEGLEKTMQRYYEVEQ